jgi:hypothetical protein
MATELAHRPDTAPTAPVRQSDNLLAQVIAAAKDPSIDAAKMETLARLVNTQQDREREIEFNQSKNAALMEMPVITKSGIILMRDKNNPSATPREQGRFAKWEDMDRVVRPILARHNLALSFDMAERQGGGITVTPILSHTNGYTQRGGAFPVPPETSGSKNAAQAMGSSASYGKRYAGTAMLNIITEGEDDDGNGGRGSVTHLPFEREQAVAVDAKAAFEAGAYADWFSKQSPKDRAWLISSGKHTEFGGQAALPSASARPPQERRVGPAQTNLEPPADEAPKKMTARDWLAKFKDDVEACANADDLDVYMDECRDALARLKTAAPTVEQEAQQAFTVRRAALTGGLV